MTSPKDQVMWNSLVRLQKDKNQSIKHQLIEALVAAILDSRISAHKPLPSCRIFAKQLGISRNTVVLAYQQLKDDGYLISRERSGYFVNNKIVSGRVNHDYNIQRIREDDAPKNLDEKIKVRPSTQRNIIKPDDWSKYPYPFLYGQLDTALFPIQGWRDCCRQALSVSDISCSTPDKFDIDDMELIEQIQARILSRRGVWASPDQILVTMGAQQSLYILSELLIDRHTKVGIEDPGYVDARNIFALRTEHLKPLKVDQSGLVPGSKVNECDLIYVTPSHQSPTTVTMELERRKQLLNDAEKSDFLIIEDDYECEINFVAEPTPALKSLDAVHRVLYVGSLSKTLAPGLRLGYMVGPAKLIHEARSIRRLMIRHPPTNNQRLVALFLALGHHDSLLQRLHQAYRSRWEIMGEFLTRYLPESTRIPTFGGTAYWIEGPKNLDATVLQQKAQKLGILIESGDIFFMNPDKNKNYFRLGYSSIAEEKIDEGLYKLAELIRTIT